MSSHAHPPSKEIDISHHIVPVGVYVRTLIILAALMALTVGVAQISIGTLGNNLVAMAIACIKATLVVLFFMNVRNGTQLIKFYAILGFLTFPLFFIMYADYEFRQHELEPAFEKRDPGSAMPRMKTDEGPTDKMMINVRPR
jgi:cytochrome c oxidase subunit IV